jgi:VRR-NUC domain-containing protein
VRILNSTIHCTKAIRELWPTPLASQWRQQYPDLFDPDDLRLTEKQPRNHFSEWFAAIHLFHREGAHSLIEKYLFQNHPRKVGLLATVLSRREREILDRVCSHYAVQPPDLLAFVPKTRRYWFAEVKGPGDRLAEKQMKSHRTLTRELGVPVEIITVKI